MLLWVMQRMFSSVNLSSSRLCTYGGGCLLREKNNFVLSFPYVCLYVCILQKNNKNKENKEFEYCSTQRIICNDPNDSGEKKKKKKSTVSTGVLFFMVLFFFFFFSNQNTCLDNYHSIIIRVFISYYFICSSCFICSFLFFNVSKYIHKCSAFFFIFYFLRMFLLCKECILA